MTGYIPATPVLGRAWCPTCEPLADPMVEILDTRYCDQHPPDRGGADDVSVGFDGALSGAAEAGGEANRIWCQLLHRDAPKNRPVTPRR